MSVHAETLSETEPNNTIATAETITANNETINGAIEGSKRGQFVVNGYSSTSDFDWYKVYLNGGTNYITCNDNGFEYLITDSNDNAITSGIYRNSGILGSTVYEVNIPSSGFYYVRIKGSVSVEKSYLFLIGSPTYSVESCNIPCNEGSVSMTRAGGARIVHFNGASLSALPKDALAYSVKSLV